MQHHEYTSRGGLKIRKRGYGSGNSRFCLRMMSGDLRFDYSSARYVGSHETIWPPGHPGLWIFGEIQNAFTGDFALPHQTHVQNIEV